MNAKISVFVTCVEAIKYYYIICMTILLMNYLKLIKEPIQKQLLTGVLNNNCFNNFLYSTGKRQWRRLHKFIFLINTTE